MFISLPPKMYIVHDPEKISANFPEKFKMALLGYLLLRSLTEGATDTWKKLEVENLV